MLDQLAHIPQRLADAGAPLRQRERVEEERREVVVQTVGEPLGARVALRKEVRVEEFLCHRGGDPVAPPRRQRIEDHGRVEMALMIRGEDHRTIESIEMLESADGHAREDAPEWKNPGRKARVPDRANRQRSVPRWENDRGQTGVSPRCVPVLTPV